LTHGNFDNHSLCVAGLHRNMTLFSQFRNVKFSVAFQTTMHVVFFTVFIHSYCRTR